MSATSASYSPRCSAQSRFRIDSRRHSKSFCFTTLSFSYSRARSSPSTDRLDRASHVVSYRNHDGAIASFNWVFLRLSNSKRLSFLISGGSHGVAMAIKLPGADPNGGCVMDSCREWSAARDIKRRSGAALISRLGFSNPQRCGDRRSTPIQYHCRATAFGQQRLLQRLSPWTTAHASPALSNWLSGVKRDTPLRSVPGR